MILYYDYDFVTMIMILITRIDHYVTLNDAWYTSAFCALTFGIWLRTPYSLFSHSDNLNVVSLAIFSKKFWCEKLHVHCVCFK